MSGVGLSVTPYPPDLRLKAYALCDDVIWSWSLWKVQRFGEVVRMGPSRWEEGEAIRAFSFSLPAHIEERLCQNRAQGWLVYAKDNVLTGHQLYSHIDLRPLALAL